MAEADEKKEPEGEEKSPDFWAADEEDATILEQTLGAENLTTPDNEPPKEPEHPSETPFSPERKAEDEKAVEEAKKELDAKPTEEKPAEEVKPAPVVEEKKPADDKDNFAWREARRLRRELKEAKEREAAAAAKAAEQKPADEISIDDLDPIERAQRDAADAKRLAEEANKRADQAEKDAERRNQERDLVAKVQRQEAAFKATHPDYDEAMQYVVEARKEQLEIMGKLDADAEFWINTHPDLVERHAQETGLDHEKYADIKAAAKDIAFRVAVQQERNQLLAACERTGRNIPEAVYNLAAKMGHKAPAAAAPAAPTPQEAAKERVQKAKASEELRQPFNQTLAAMDNNHAPLPKKISSRAELMRMPEDEMDKLIAENDEKNPGWFSNLDE
jgi:ribosomal protein L12E/L44/L45/RPP1/RPP2